MAKKVERLNEGQMDLGLMSMYRMLAIILVVVAVVALAVGYNKGWTWLMFGSTVPLCVAIYYYLNFRMKRDEIVQKLVNDKEYTKRTSAPAEASEEA